MLRIRGRCRRSLVDESGSTALGPPLGGLSGHPGACPAGDGWGGGGARVGRGLVTYPRGTRANWRDWATSRPSASQISPSSSRKPPVTNRVVN